MKSLNVTIRVRSDQFLPDMMDALAGEELTWEPASVNPECASRHGQVPMYFFGPLWALEDLAALLGVAPGQIAGL